MRQDADAQRKHVKTTDKTKNMSHNEQSYMAAESPRTRPWLLSVPHYGCDQSQSNEEATSVSIDYRNDSKLSASAKGDPAWHCRSIPLKRRKVLSLPSFTWEREAPDEAHGQVHIPPSQNVDEAGVQGEEAEVPPDLRDIPARIPLEREKRKSARSERHEEHDSQPLNSKQTTGENWKPLKIHRTAPDASPVSISTSSNSSSIAVRAPLRAQSNPGVYSSPVTHHRHISSLPSSSSSTSTSLLSRSAVSASSSSPGKEPTLTSSPEIVRSLSPPMRIVSVRSLANLAKPTTPATPTSITTSTTGTTGTTAPVTTTAVITTPAVDEPLGERILVDPKACRAGSSPLYIFNPVHPILDIPQSSLSVATNEPPVGDLLCDTAGTSATTSGVHNKCLEQRVNVAQCGQPRQRAPMDRSRSAELNVFFEDELEPGVQVGVVVPPVETRHRPRRGAVESHKPGQPAKRARPFASATVELGGGGKRQTLSTPTDRRQRELGNLGKTAARCGSTLNFSPSDRGAGDDCEPYGEKPPTSNNSSDCWRVSSGRQGGICSLSCRDDDVFDVAVPSCGSGSSSPFADSDASDVSFEDFEVVDVPCEASANFTANIIKQLDENERTPDANSVDDDDDDDKCPRRPSGELLPATSATKRKDRTTPHDPNPTQTKAASGTAAKKAAHAATAVAAATENQENCCVDRRLPKLRIRLPVLESNGLPSCSLSSAELDTNRQRRKKTSWSSDSASDVSYEPTSSSSPLLSTSSTVEQSLKAFNVRRSSRNAAAARKPKKRQEKRRREQKIKAMESIIVLSQMQLMTKRDQVQFSNTSLAVNKLFFLEELADYFSRNDFSKEPLNRSILNTMAEWLSPSPDGQLPPVKLRDTLIELIKGFTLTTPTHIFQTSSIESVLKLLINHPDETLRNKSLVWDIVNSWRNDL